MKDKLTELIEWMEKQINEIPQSEFRLGINFIYVKAKSLQQETNDGWIRAIDQKPTRADADENGYLDCAFWNNSKCEYYRGSAIWVTIANEEDGGMTMWKKSIPLPLVPKKDNDSPLINYIL